VNYDTWGDVADAADATRHSRLAIDIDTVGEMVRLTHDELTPEMRRKITYG
jgi:ribosome recycling factor